MQKALTDVLVRSLAAPTSGRLEVSDARCQGLTLRVTAAGVKSWSFRFRDPNSARVTRATIGTYPEVSLADARERASEMRRGVAAGRNPVEEKRRAREEADQRTFTALADRYLNEHARRFKRSAAADERNLRLHILPHWGRRAYSDIKRRDVIELCEGMVAAGTATNANRVQALISTIFSFAIDADLVEANPCARLRKRGAESARQRVLDDQEVRLFWDGIVNKPVSRPVGLALRLALLTAARVSEVAEVEMREFQHLDDPERAAWMLPPERSKNGRAHLVPLPPLARQIVLEAAQLAGEDARFLFPSPAVEDAPLTGHALSVAMARFGAGLKDADKNAASWKDDPPSPHDLRRTVATKLASLGTPAEDVSAIMNHTRRDVTGVHYDRYDRAREKRVALAMLEKNIRAVIGSPADISVAQVHEIADARN